MVAVDVDFLWVCFGVIVLGCGWVGGGAMGRIRNFECRSGGKANDAMLGLLQGQGRRKCELRSSVSSTFDIRNSTFPRCIRQGIAQVAGEAVGHLANQGIHLAAEAKLAAVLHRR